MARNRIFAAWRKWFEAGGFVEVDTAALQVSPGNEAHIGAFATEWRTPAGDRQRFYLHTSPEFACKKLLAAGERKIFALARVFRNGERGPLHHPEFTMLEWYRAGAAYDTLVADCQGLAQAAVAAAGGLMLQWRGARCDPQAPVERLDVVEAFARHAGIDLMASLASSGADRDVLAAQVAAIGIRVGPDDGWRDLFSKVIAEKIEPQLGLGQLTVLDRYPTSEAALARPCADDARFAERFELYACGVELANAFGELTDPAEQRRRFEIEMAERERIYGEEYPIDAEFLVALEGMPAASGIALGADRLVMLATGAQSIDQVLWTPVAGACDAG